MKSNKVIRYVYTAPVDYYLEEDADGEWVSYYDYQKLLDTVEQLNSALKNLAVKFSEGSNEIK